MMNKYRIYNGMWIYKFAPHTEQQLSSAQTQQLLRTGGWAVRNAYHFDCPAGSPTNFWYVIKDQFGDIAELPTKTRNQVRRALRTYDYEIIDKQFMLDHGYDIYKKASESYSVAATPPTLEAYRQRILSSTDEDEFWGAIDKESHNLVAIAINHTSEETCDYRALKAYPEDVKNYVYYGLIFTMNEYYLKTKRYKYVCDGARSATNHSNIQPFLIEKFNFRKAFCDMRITYKWWFHGIIILLLPLYSIMPSGKIKTLLTLHKMQN